MQDETTRQLSSAGSLYCIYIHKRNGCLLYHHTCTLKTDTFIHDRAWNVHTPDTLMLYTI